MARGADPEEHRFPYGEALPPPPAALQIGACPSQSPDPLCGPGRQASTPPPPQGPDLQARSGLGGRPGCGAPLPSSGHVWPCRPGSPAPPRLDSPPICRLTPHFPQFVVKTTSDSGDCCSLEWRPHLHARPVPSHLGSGPVLCPHLNSFEQYWSGVSRPPSVLLGCSDAPS